jgi:hypothetical protein
MAQSKKCPLCKGRGHVGLIITQQKVRPEVTLGGMPLKFPDLEIERTSPEPCSGCNGDCTVSAERYRELLAEIGMR